MPLSYDRLWKLLIDRKMKKVDLRTIAGITPQALADMGKEKPISMAALLKICEALKVQPGDIMEYISEGGGADDT